MSNVVSQEAMTTTIFLSIVSQGATTAVDCDEHAGLRQQQPTFMIIVDQPHQQSRRREAPVIMLITMPRQQC
jgi:hypothetical protein